MARCRNRRRCDARLAGNRRRNGRQRRNQLCGSDRGGAVLGQTSQRAQNAGVARTGIRALSPTRMGRDGDSWGVALGIFMVIRSARVTDC